MKDDLFEQSRIAELRVLKSLSKGKWPKSIQLTEEHFLHPTKRKMFNILSGLKAKGDHVNYTDELAAEINTYDELTRDSLIVLLGEIDSDVIEVKDPEPHAKQLDEFLKERRSFVLLENISKKAMNGEDTIPKIEAIHASLLQIKEIYKDDFFKHGQEYKFIFPGVDIVDDAMYFCVNRPEIITTDSKGKPHIAVENATYIISSKREFFRVNEDNVLLEIKLILRTKPTFHKPDRWKFDCIKSWLYENYTVKPSETFDYVFTVFDKYIDFEANYSADLLACWAIGTYLFPIFHSYPYIALWGPRASGKTKVENVAEKLCLNALYSADISTSALFRTIEGSSCTVLIDEAESLQDTKRSQDMLNLLHAGYKRGGTVDRSEGEKKFEPKSFEVYSPKMIATIKGMLEVLESRCIRITMLRTKNSEKANRNVSDSGEDWQQIRHMLYCFAMQFFQDIRGLYEDINRMISDEGISGRDAELWSPIIAISKFLNENGCDGLYEKILQLAKKKSEEAHSTGIDDFTNAMLLAIRDITTFKEEDIFIKEIKEKQSSYLEIESDKINNKKIGAAIRGLSLAEKGDRTSQGYKYTIRRKAVEDLLERYGI